MPYTIIILSTPQGGDTILLNGLILNEAVLEVYVFVEKCIEDSSEYDYSLGEGCFWNQFSIS